MSVVGFARAGIRRIHHELTQWYYVFVRHWFGLLFAGAYVAAIGSIAHFLWRSSSYPTTWEFLLLVVVLVCYMLVALSAD